MLMLDSSMLPPLSTGVPDDAQLWLPEWLVCRLNHTDDNSNTTRPKHCMQGTVRINFLQVLPAGLPSIQEKEHHWLVCLQCLHRCCFLCIPFQHAEPQLYST